MSKRCKIKRLSNSICLKRIYANSKGESKLLIDDETKEYQNRVWKQTYWDDPDRKWVNKSNI